MGKSRPTVAQPAAMSQAQASAPARTRGIAGARGIRIVGAVWLLIIYLFLDMNLEAAFRVGPAPSSDRP
ncbi:hypothetical protein KKG45_10270 [bacterium]|nr:hypothetical protein [bacterium]MBU1073621.1 hypothetical protein [bacterium]MBU1676598.1 hypothetical protein [bacterium]